jgi:hypothetical protein
MIFIRQIIFVFILCFTHVALAQTTCDTIPADLLKQFNKYSQKKFTKLMRDKKTDLNTIYYIATYFRAKGDTTSKQWYILFTNGLKYYWSNDKRRGSRACMLFTTGKVYCYLNDYPEAITYFTKAIAAKCPDPCINYFFEKTNKIIK